ncbi:MAG: tetratricopeptide repeat protein [Acidobacteriota bacterium]
MAANLHNLAAVEQERGRLAEAEATYRRALALKEKIFGGDNVDVALTVNNLGLLLKALGSEEEAAELLQRALVIFEKTLEDDHPHLIACRENLESA